MTHPVLPALTRRVTPIVCAAALLAGTISPAAAQSAPTPDPADVVQQFAEAVNRADWQAAEALLTPNVIVVDGPCDGICIGPEEVVQDNIIPLTQGPDASLRVQLVGEPQVSGDTVTARLEIHFAPIPPELTEMGFERLVQLNSFLIQDGQIAAWSGVDDVADSQTQGLVRMDSTSDFSEDETAALPAARDGQTLATQAVAVQISYLTQFGEQAYERWAQDHNAALDREEG